MTNNRDNRFEELEKLNALIDVWIDDEKYESVCDYAKGIKPNNDKLFNHDQTAESRISACFPEVKRGQNKQEKDCTHDKDDQWRKALDYEIDFRPVVKVGDEDLYSDKYKDDPLTKYWAHLLYAKLLRAKIQRKGSSDCYTRRLDDIAAYLERHLPKHNKQDDWATRLTLMYLMELSATSPDWESSGFSERARRVIIDAKHSIKTKSLKAPYDFYELWARYNIGVAYFHQAYYRKAVLEFNKVIWQVENWDKRTENRKFFDRNHGIELLYLPAILYRAEVQLKLQFAYHSLDTLDKRFWNNEDEKILVKKRRTRQKEIRAMLIEAQAYQQMGRLDESWGILSGVKNSKVEEKQKGICKLITDDVQLGQRKGCNIPEPKKLKVLFPNLGERFLDILIADHLDWLTFRGKDFKQPALELTELVKRGDAEPNSYIRAVNDAESYLNRLVNAFSSYFKVAEHHAYNRRGYFQQLAKYLAWLAKAADLKLPDSDCPSGREKIAAIAKELYDKAKKDGLLSEEYRLGNPKKGCHYCKAKGIDLRRIESEHYTWFTEDILEFFNSKDIFIPREIDEDKKEFVRRLISLERETRDDLRIRDLELRYEYYGMEGLLTELCEIERKELLAGLSEIERERLLTDLCEKENEKRRAHKYAERLCWGEAVKDHADLLELLLCNRTIPKGQDPFGKPSTADVYTNIMKRWDDSFLRHLKSPSTHEVPASGFYFLGLQRWNSASPAKGFSVGGGYLLYHIDSKNRCVDMGIAIDPGFDFVRNLFHMGFSLNDIDIVLISHAHLDHIRDFESIVMLLSELQKRGKREKRVHVILSLGAYKRLEHIIEDPGYRYFVEPYIIDVDREIHDNYFEKEMPEFRFEPVNTNGERASSNSMERIKAVLPGKEFSKGLRFRVMITPTRAYHDDKTYSDSFGFVVELAEKVKGTGGQDKHEVKLAFGYTGDTKWVYPGMPDPVNKKDNGENKLEERKIEDIAGQYFNCDVLLVHLGSLITKNDDGEFSFNQYDQCGINAADKYRCEELVRKENHPYLIGMLRLLSSLYENLSEVKRIGMPLVLVGEFGEELRGTIRSDFIQRLQGIYKNGLAFLPVDVGMNVYLRRKGDEQDNSRGNRCACRVWCVQCNHFVNIGDANFELYGTDHALYCVCKTCRKATPTNVLQDRLRQLYEVGLELRPYESK